MDHVRKQLAEFKRLGFATVFVSTSPEISPEDLKTLEPLCNIIVQRENEGYDFVSWKVGYDLIRSEMDGLESLILMNDSCLGPYHDLGPVFEKMSQDPGAVWGIRKSAEMGEYIQSYFFHFGEKAFSSGALNGFIDRIRILRTKWGIVRYFEIGGSRWLKKRGFGLKALVDPSEERIAALMRAHRCTDPVHDPVGTLLVEKGISPFYKRSNVRAGINT